MKSFRGFMALVGLLFAGTHLLRHSYVLWVEPRTSVLDEFDEAKKVAGAEKSLQELLEAYRQVHQEAEALRKESENLSSEEQYRLYKQKNSFSKEEDLKRAIH